MSGLKPELPLGDHETVSVQEVQEVHGLERIPVAPVGKSMGSGLLLGALAFVTSAAVLVIEIVAARLLAPYVGVTLETYTAIIATVLAGISGGAWLGGRLADRVAPLRALPPVLIVGGVLTLLSLPIVRIVGGRLSTTTPLSVTTLTAAAFLAPAIVLSMVTPLLIKQSVVTLETTGRTVGSLSALSTAGALAGSITTGFVLVPRFRSRVILGIVGALIIALGVVVWAAVSSKLRASRGGANDQDDSGQSNGKDQLGRKLGGTALGLAVAVGGGGVAGFSDWRDPCTMESSYFCASVSETPGTSRRDLILDDVFHSEVDLKDPTHLGFDYTRAFNVAIDAWKPEPTAVRALHIGGGGFTMPRELKATRPGSDSLVLEIDPKLVEFDQRELGLELASDLRTQAGDGRMGLRQQKNQTYDLVIGDAFGGQSVPWHLTTIEVARDVKRVLTNDGLYVLNVIDSPPSKFVKAEIATVQAVFQHVAVLTYPEAIAGQVGANFIVVASPKPLALAEMRRVLATQPDLNMIGIDGGALSAFVGKAKVLTDELAPVAQLITIG
jgi:spermidine synthase/MFS family permease